MDRKIITILKITLFEVISIPDIYLSPFSSGDFRMTFGEDRNKVKNIVGPQIGKFRELYAPFWTGLAAYADFNSSSGRCEQDTSPSARMFHLNLLPKQIQVTYATPLHAREHCESRHAPETFSHEIPRPSSRYQH